MFYRISRRIRGTLAAVFRCRSFSGRSANALFLILGRSKPSADIGKRIAKLTEILRDKIQDDYGPTRHFRSICYQFDRVS